jgi:hypothetical protein
MTAHGREKTFTAPPKLAGQHAEDNGANCSQRPNRHVYGAEEESDDDHGDAVRGGAGSASSDEIGSEAGLKQSAKDDLLLYGRGQPEVHEGQPRRNVESRQRSRLTELT